MPSQICSIPECFIALSTRAWLVPSVSAPISSTAEWVFTQLSTILLSFTLEWAFVLSNCLPTMMWNHTGCFVLTFLLCVYKWYFKLLAWEDIYIFTVIAFCLNILRCVFSVFKWLEDKLSHWLHLSNFSDMRKLLYNICTFSRNEAFTQRELSCASSSCFHKKTF